MDVQAWTFVIVGITFALYIGIAIWSRAASTKEYYTASGSVSPFANGMATAADSRADSHAARRRRQAGVNRKHSDGQRNGDGYRRTVERGGLVRERTRRRPGGSLQRR